MAVVLTIGGDVKELLAGTLHISKTANGRATAAFSISTLTGDYRPPLDDEVIITEDGDRIFGGVIDRPSEKGYFNGSRAEFVTAVSAVDFGAYTERRFANIPLQAGTLKELLEELIIYLTPNGVTLHGSQVDGPDLPQLTYVWRRIDEIFNELATLTAESGQPFVWQIDAFKVLRFFQPSTIAAPFNVIGNDPSQVQGDIEVETTREHYANRVIIRIPTSGEAGREETFTGDGTTPFFQLSYAVTRHRGYVTVDGVQESLGAIGEGRIWEYDPDNLRITRSSAPHAGATIVITFDGTFGGFAFAQDNDEINDHGVWEKAFTVDSVQTSETETSVAASFLARCINAGKTIKYRTLESGLEAGMSQAIEVPRRNLDVDAVITDIVIRDFGKDRLVRDVTAVIDNGQTNLGRGWRDVYRSWLGDAAGGGTNLGGGTPGRVGPGGPDTAVQFNDGGGFGGEAEFTYDKTTHSLVMGAGGSAITAGAAESCSVFGYDNVIEDPP